jgi:hypothetical protein
MPKKWEYLQVYRLDKDFNVFSSKGEYLKEEYYRSVDPKASWDQWVGRWKIKVDPDKFLMAILNKLGTDGWEVVVSMESTGPTSTTIAQLILKRPID